jgi:hypothetical protein
MTMWKRNDALQKPHKRHAASKQASKNNNNNNNDNDSNPNPSKPELQSTETEKVR